VQGVGEKWLFSATSRGFGYGFEAVRIRVNYKNSDFEKKLIRLGSYILYTFTIYELTISVKKMFRNML
jgi:hypothetical protein